MICVSFSKSVGLMYGMESKIVLYSYHPIYGRKLDYGNNIHPYNNNIQIEVKIEGTNG